MEEKKNPKVLIGIPVSEQHGYATQRLLGRIESLTYPNYEILIIDNSKTEEHFKSINAKRAKVIRDFFWFKRARDKLVDCRNYMRKIVLENNYDYLLCIDQDVIPPTDLIERLLSNDKEIVTGIYYNYYKKTDGNLIKMPVIWGFFNEDDIANAKSKLDKIREINPLMYNLLKENPDNKLLIQNLKKPISVKEATSGKLLDIRVCGTGCILIYKKVLEKIEFRYDANTDLFDDTFFCEDALKLDYKIYADTRVQCEHLIREAKWTWEEIKARGEM